MITDISGDGCTTIESWANRDTVTICPDNISKSKEVTHEQFLSGIAGETLFHHTLEVTRPVVFLRDGYEDIYVEVKRSDGSYVDVSILEKAFLGSVKFNPNDPNHYIEYKPRIWAYDELPGHDGGTIKVTKADNPQPGSTQFLSREQIVAILQNTLNGKK